MSPHQHMSHLFQHPATLMHQPSITALQDVASPSENSLAAFSTAQSVASRALSRAATATSADEVHEAEQQYIYQHRSGLTALQDGSMDEDVTTDGGDSMDDGEKEPGASGGTEPKAWLEANPRHGAVVKPKRLTKGGSMA